MTVEVERTHAEVEDGKIVEVTETVRLSDEEAADAIIGLLRPDTASEGGRWEKVKQRGEVSVEREPTGSGF